MCSAVSAEFCVCVLTRSHVGSRVDQRARPDVRMDPLESLKAAFPTAAKPSVDGSSFGIPAGSARFAGSQEAHPAFGFIYPATSFGAASGPDIAGSLPEIRGAGIDLVDPFTREVTLLPGRAPEAPQPRCWVCTSCGASWG